MLRIEIVKQLDGTGLLRCTRDDGSVTWQKQTKHSAHFALHDLTHFAVETGLGYQEGFFGLIESGWDIEDTTGKGERGPLRSQTLEVEQIVGLLDTERASGVSLTSRDFELHGPRVLTESELQRVRDLRLALFRQWSAIEPGQKLDLTFAFHPPAPSPIDIAT